MIHTQANRGKQAETLVKKALDNFCKQSAFAAFRAPDARAGSLTQALADYIICKSGMMLLLEVKQTDHPYRLPVGNFKLQQRARMRMFEAAGAVAQVLVYHRTEDVWHLEGLDFFGTLDTGSWDMRESASYQSCEEALGQL